MFGQTALRDSLLALECRDDNVHALIIEDEMLIAMTIEDTLRDLGFTSFDLAPSPQTAIDAAERHVPDLITSDVQLKPGCGIATVMTIIERRVVPVIFITGNVPDVMERLPECRALSKPFSASQLATAVHAALS